ncbi:DDE-type integrase/transposase/recombinase [Burkholderia oklahomensis]|nr:DDE-type integrase/transposase/recombinase [Burkholderia oklahomensis]
MKSFASVNGVWKYLYRADDKAGNTAADFQLRAHRDKAAARRYFEKSISQNDAPRTVTGVSFSIAKKASSPVRQPYVCPPVPQGPSAGQGRHHGDSLQQSGARFDRRRGRRPCRWYALAAGLGLWKYTAICSGSEDVLRERRTGAGRRLFVSSRRGHSRPATCRRHAGRNTDYAG